jgi:hypothetical protein
VESLIDKCSLKRGDLGKEGVESLAAINGCDIEKAQERQRRSKNLWEEINR